MATILETVQALGKIITDAVTDGTTANIPAMARRTTLVRVATGRYLETPPIMVPAECCIMGDELRATNVQPRTVYNSTLTNKNDFTYTYQAMQRMEDIINDVVSGVAVTPTTGNYRTQDVTYPFSEHANVGLAAEKIARNIKRRSDIGVANKIEGTLPPAYSVTPAESGLARDLISRNKDFLREEVIAYITTNYPNLNYSRTKCKQDVGFIIDALAYDLSYGGNWQTQNAGLAYYNGVSGTLQINSTEKAATLAAYGLLRDHMMTLGRDVVINPTEQATVTQVRGVGGDNTTATTIQSLMNGMIDVIDNGPANSSITYPSLGGVDSALVTAATTLTNALPTIQTDTIDFVSKNFGSFKYNSAKCRRDITNIATDVAFDVVLGTNYNAVFNGMAYQRPNNAYNLQTQRKETIGAIRKARDLGLDETSDATAETRWTNGIDTIVDIIRNGTLGEVYPGDGTVPALSFPAPTGVDQNKIDAKDLLQANRAFLQADVVAYVNNTYNSPPGAFPYDSAKCSRDVGYIVDALCYDILYGGSMAASRIAESYFVDGSTQVYGQETETIAAYNHLSTIAQQVIQEATVTAQSGNAETQSTTGSPASGTEATELGNAMTIITDALTAGNLDSLPAVVYPDVLWAAAALRNDKTAIDAARPQIVKDVVQFVSDTYSDFTYNHAKCERDLGLIVTAAQYDWMLGTNYASLQAAYSYLRAPSSKVVGYQKDATIAANEYARTLAIANVGGNATAIAGINETWEWVQDTIWAGSAEGGNSQVADQEVYNAKRMLEINKEFIVDEAVAYVEDYFKDTVTATTGATGGLDSNLVTISDTSWLKPGMDIKFSIESGDTATDLLTNALLDVDVTYTVREIYSATQFRVESGGTNNETSLNDYSGVTWTIKKAYTYNADICKRDLREYIEAMMWDMTYAQEWPRNYTDNVSLYLPGAYKFRLGARYYVNSINGAQEEDFYYMRNGTGIRLQTLDGLRGDLGPANEYGTSRPTAGAYCSLDPGFGPEDRNVWITARSPYMQNNTCFGNAAVGQKIDGALHNGGNDSMVSNDFTQVISDGIGAWLINNGRAEMVSVFTYYAHIGYLCETGGRARATNGNNSYGTFGSVAEGVDPDEIPVEGLVDNSTQYGATISQVLTDQDTLLQVEYSHAGNDYTEATINIFGPGDNEEVVADEFRDKGVPAVNVGEVETGDAGGTNYTIVSNTAQTGTSTSLTIAATDGALSSAYVGMKIYITAGAGNGLYGVIDTYNAGSKLATVIKDSDGSAGWDHVVPGTTFVAPNASSTYQIEPRIEFAAPSTTTADYTINSDTYPDLHFMETTAQYTAITSSSQQDGSGATFDITRNGEKYYVEINAGGQEYQRLDTLTISGTDVGGTSPANDITVTATTVSTTGAIEGFDFRGVGQRGVYIALADAGVTSRISTDGDTWTSITTPSITGTDRHIASGFLDDGSTTYYQSYAVATVSGSNTIMYSVDGETWATSTLPVGMATGNKRVAAGNVALGDNRFVVIDDADTDIAYSLNGGVGWTLAGSALPSTGYTAIAYGKGMFVAIKAGSQEMAYSEDGVTWTQVAAGMPAADNWVDITWGNGRFIAVADDSNDIAYSLDGITWVAVTATTSTNYPRRISYGQGAFVVTTPNTTTLYHSTHGLVWDTVTVTAHTGGYNSTTFGNNNHDPKFLALGNAGTTAAREIKVGVQAKGRASVASEKIFAVRMIEPGCQYTSAPAVTVTDPGNIEDVILNAIVKNGVMAQPTFNNRGSGFTTATGEIDDQTSNGGAEFVQSGNFIAVKRLTEIPVSGSNIVFSSLPDQTFKLVNTVSLLGTQDGSYTAFLQVSPEMTINDAPPDEDPVTMRIRFSQVRLTGHDFLDIGTGGFTTTNYPNQPVIPPDQTKETYDSNGGRVFFTATDQDGNFRVGDLFSIEQATGVATLNAEAFNIAGLQELTLGEVTLGGNSASVTEFSTDPFFTANSDSVVPTQRAVKAYIEAQIGGGGATLNVNSVTAGDIFINTDQITTVSGATINIKANVNFSGFVTGLPVAYNYFLR